MNQIDKVEVLGFVILGDFLSLALLLCNSCIIKHA
jgi:hypothetical protein